MYRLLVVEDQTEFYQDYLLRIFERTLPMETISIVHVPTLNAALMALLEPSWDMILMDYNLGPKAEFLGDPVRDGADLIAFRRAAERTQPLPKAYILGIGGNQVGNQLMLAKGANHVVLKIRISEMVDLIRGMIKGMAEGAAKAT